MTNDESGEPSDLALARPRIPLIHLAQQQHVSAVQQAFQTAAEGEPDDPTAVSMYPNANMRRILTTISERTELSEASAHWPSRNQYLGVDAPRLADSSPATSYGKLLSE